MTHEVGYRKALNTLLSAQLAFVPREWMKKTSVQRSYRIRVGDKGRGDGLPW